MDLFNRIRYKVSVVLSGIRVRYRMKKHDQSFAFGIFVVSMDNAADKIGRIVYDPDRLRWMDSPIGFSTLARLDANECIPEIIVDDDFLRLSKETRDFVIAHEIGHLMDEEVYRQMEGYAIASSDGSTRSHFICGMEVEYRADFAAMCLCGKQSALHSIREIGSELHRIQGVRNWSISDRIQKLESSEVSASDYSVGIVWVGPDMPGYHPDLVFETRFCNGGVHSTAV